MSLAGAMRSKESERILKILEAVARFPVAGDSQSATVGLTDLDDGAVLPMCDGTDLVVCSDFVRGTGFDLFQLGLLTWEDIGFYLVGANASDLAAMGASPLGITIVVRYSPDLNDQDYESLVSGIAEACSRFSLPLLGGDSGSSTTCVLSASALGTCPRDRALLRSRGVDGDALYITGTVGLAAAAMAYFKRDQAQTMRLDESAEYRLLSSWQRVQPAIGQGAFLVKERLSRCAIDTSDGLAVSCQHLAEASRVDIVLSKDSIPIDAETTAVARLLEIDPLRLALSESVDFRLLFSVNANAVPALEREFSARKWPLFRIGDFREASADEPTVWVSESGQLTRLLQGHDSRLPRGRQAHLP
jgi:thiamine-monophosphate kinase